FVIVSPALSSKRRRVIRAVDLESLFSETDSPVVGKTPSDVITVVTEIASLKGVSIEDAGETITKSIKDYFYI
ncbi:MAG: TatD family hydrolase, partial [Candidatus Marsarchaeota archaeon]|nr:TatD family hydrolase [Candidatus Marsarchaeota archaeon]